MKDPQREIPADGSLEGLSVKDLRELRGRVDAAIAARQIEDRSSLREQFRSLAEEAGYGLDEILGGTGSGRGARGRSSGGAKYANPANPSETWSGRGRQPKWLSARIKAGASREDFKI